MDYDSIKIMNLRVSAEQLAELEYECKNRSS